MATATAPPPSNTVYVRNLEETVKIPDLIEALSNIFSSFGPILEIVAKKNLRAKGQAFVVFESASSAAAAIDDIQGFDLFDRPMALAFARSRSDATVRQAAGSDAAAFEAHRAARLAEKERKQALRAAEEQDRRKRPAATQGAAADGLSGVAGARPGKAAKTGGLKSTHAAAAIVPDEYLPPNKILFLQNLPDGYDVDGLTAVFGRFDGFREVRLVPGRSGIAFVEYESEAGAVGAKEGTAGMPLGDEGKLMKVTFQRQ